MTTYSHGADPEELDRVARRLKASALDVQKVRQASDGAVGTLRAAWRGGDLDTAFGAWERTGSTDLRTLEKALRDMSHSLTREATQQRRASGIGGPDGDPGGRRQHTGPTPRAGDPGGRRQHTGPTPRAGEPSPGGHAGGGGGGGGGGGWPEDDDSPEVTSEHKRTWDHNQREWKGERDYGDPTGEPEEEGWKHETTVELTGFETGEKHAEVYQQTWGNEDANVTVSALQATASADGSVTVGKDGVEANVGGHAAAYAVRVQAAYANEYGTQAAGEAYVGAEANAEASASIGLDGVQAHAGGDAFVGGKATGEVSQEIMGTTTTVGGEVSYGIGVHGSADANFSMEKVGFSLDGGAALGLGVGVNIDVSVNPSEVIDSVDALAHGDWGGIF